MNNESIIPHDLKLKAEYHPGSVSVATKNVADLGGLLLLPYTVRACSLPGTEITTGAGPVPPVTTSAAES